MRTLFKYLILLILITVAVTCTEPYTPELDKYENILVVDGIITNEEGPYTVRLSRSYPYNESQAVPETRASVLIRDDQGNVTALTENSPGVYTTVDPGFRGIIGRQYQVHIYTGDDQVWESEYVDLKHVPEIDSLYAEFGERSENNEMEEGFQIYVDTEDPENQTRYYRYDFEETWEFHIPYPSYYLVENQELVFRTENVGRCWKTSPSENILVTTSENMESDVVRHFPVNFVSTHSSRLSVKYSILVKQYSLSREAYLYWEQLRVTNQELGTLFDKQPSQVRGNIYNLDNPDIPVIGFFEATAVDSERLFLTRSDLPSGIGVRTEFFSCMYEYLVIPKNEYLIYSEWGYCMVNDASTAEIIFGLGIVRPFTCCDCTLSGTNIRPSFWQK